MYMIFFVLDDPTKLDDLLEAWEKAGIRGATIVESTGIHRQLKRVIPFRYSFQNASRSEESHFTLFTQVASEEMVQICLEATEKVTGNLEEEHTGFFSAWPVRMSKGFRSEGGT